eukprot:SAG31_NODE_32768_length_352_cov_0.533597_1_plen_41_part_01
MPAVHAPPSDDDVCETPEISPTVRAARAEAASERAARQDAE